MKSQHLSDEILRHLRRFLFPLACDYLPGDLDGGYQYAGDPGGPSRQR
jgi:hypothetical protein